MTLHHLTLFSGDIEAFSLTDEFFPPGSYVLNIEAIDVLGQSAILDVPFTLAGIVRCGIVLLYCCSIPGKCPWVLKRN